MEAKQFDNERKRLIDGPSALGESFVDGKQAPAAFGEALVSMIRCAVRAEIESLKSIFSTELLTPEELASRLKVPMSWVYEQSRLGKIPTHRIGRYLRFDLAEVLASQKKTS